MWKYKDFINDRFIYHSNTESWGSSVLIMEKSGKAFGRIYWYNDDSTTVYLDWLSVDIEVRRQGIGTQLQEIREKIGKSLGAVTSCLFVKKDSWMHGWYKRRGYSDIKEHDYQEGFIWMEKLLVKNKRRKTR